MKRFMVLMVVVMVASLFGQPANLEEISQLKNRIVELEERVQYMGAQVAHLMTGQDIIYSYAFPVTVNYDQSLEEMIKAGNYGMVNGDITSEHFPANRQGKEEIEIQIVHFARRQEISVIEVFAKLDSIGLRPATLPELLAFGAKYPDKEKEFTVVALGSVWENPETFHIGEVVGIYRNPFDQSRILVPNVRVPWRPRSTSFAAVPK